MQATVRRDITDCPKNRNLPNSLSLGNAQNHIEKMTVCFPKADN